MSLTPAPWTADIEAREVINPRAVLRELRVIAEIHADDEHGSNTRAIAAVPDMLAALELVHEQIRTSSPDERCRKMIAVALEKAKPPPR